MTYDAVVVGARCAGAPTAMLLARQGHRVLLVDRASFPSDTISNGMFNSPKQPQPGDHGFQHWFSTQNNAVPSHENPKNFVRNGKRVGPVKGFVRAHVRVHSLKSAISLSWKVLIFIVNPRLAANRSI